MCKHFLIKEHGNVKLEGLSDAQLKEVKNIQFPKNTKNSEKNCIQIIGEDYLKKIEASYYIGVDWLNEKEYAVCVESKINNDNKKLDILKMLTSAVKHPDTVNHLAGLYEIKFTKPYIPINQQQDEITPLLILHFLQLLKQLVQKGLRKSYYKVTENLTARVKGKILVGATIKQNLQKSQVTAVICQYDRFGFNGIENKILKRTLVFIQRYLADYSDIYKNVAEVLNYCLPAFHEVSEDVSVREIQRVTHNPFYKEYKEALTVAGYILRRFGYNINNNAKEKFVVPPYWIDMPKLFELYVFGLLKDKFGDNIKYQEKGNYGNPDFLLKKECQKMIIDTKYKKDYQEEKGYKIEDIRQLSGYARDIKILKRLGYINEDDNLDADCPIVDCLIIYPDQGQNNDFIEEFKNYKIIKQFAQFYKTPIKLPELKKT